LGTGLASADRTGEASLSRRSALKARYNRFALQMLRRYWRFQRGMTLGAQGVLIDDANRVLMIKHTYVPGWYFPGGGVEPGESFEDAARREVREEVGAEITGPIELHGIFANFARVKRDHIALFVIRHWQRDGDYRQKREIAEARWFAYDELPADVDPGSKQRIREILDGLPPPTHWI
jgi:8-oxo-dGTP pyrophosphatase MutT (NUDIX family)